MKKSIVSLLFVFLLFIALIFFRAWVVGTDLYASLPAVPRVVLLYILWWVILVPICLLMRRDKEKPNDLGFTKDKLFMQVLIGVILGLVTSITLSVTISLAGQRQFFYGVSGSIEHLPSAGALAFSLFEAIILTGLVEEVVFRGYLYKKMMDIKNSKWLTIVVTALLFGLMHIVNVLNATELKDILLGIISPMVFGFIYGICRAYLKNCSLTSLIICHGVHNTLNGVVIFGIIDSLAK